MRVDDLVESSAVRPSRAVEMQPEEHRRRFEHRVHDVAVGLRVVVLGEECLAVALNPYRVPNESSEHAVRPEVLTRARL